MPTQTLAFFGATGDIAGFCLVAALKHDYTCIALARTPENLSASMAAKGVSQDLRTSHLTIIKGDVRDVEAVKRALVVEGRVVDLIVSGVGCTSFNFTWNPILPFVLTDSTICQDATRTLFAALTSLSTANKPLMINISTTGISTPDKPRDIPLAWYPFYHWLLHSPHADKTIMEADVREELAKHEEERVIRANVNVRPSLLVEGSKGWENLKVGTDEEPVRGYFVERRDVGEFVFENLIRREVPEEWLNGGVHVTH